MTEPLRVSVLASHRGSSLQAVLDATSAGELNAIVVAVISNNSRAQALQRARDAGVPACHISSQTHEDEDAAIRAMLNAASTELVLTLGYMKKLGPLSLAAYRGRVLNTHPSLLPKHGGQGMFGEHVHAAVLAAGETETGASIHLVEPEYDTGSVIAQRRVPVEGGDKPGTLADRVLAEEHLMLVETLRRIEAGETLLPGLQRP